MNQVAETLGRVTFDEVSFGAAETLRKSGVKIIEIDGRWFIEKNLEVEDNEDDDEGGTIILQGRERRNKYTANIGIRPEANFPDLLAQRYSNEPARRTVCFLGVQAYKMVMTVHSLMGAKAKFDFVRKGDVASIVEHIYGCKVSKHFTRFLQHGVFLHDDLSVEYPSVIGAIREAFT